MVGSEGWLNAELVFNLEQSISRDGGSMPGDRVKARYRQHILDIAHRMTFNS